MASQYHEVEGSKGILEEEEKTAEEKKATKKTTAKKLTKKKSP